MRYAQQLLFLIRLGERVVGSVRLICGSQKSLLPPFKTAAFITLLYACLDDRPVSQSVYLVGLRGKEETSAASLIYGHVPHTA